MALPGAGGMGLPDGSVGRVLLGGIGFLSLCSPDVVCLMLLVGLLCVGVEGVSSLLFTWTSSLQDADFLFGVTPPVVVLCMPWLPGSGWAESLCGLPCLMLVEVCLVSQTTRVLRFPERVVVCGGAWAPCSPAGGASSWCCP